MCVGGEEPCGHTEGRAAVRLVLLEFSPKDEHPVAVSSRGELHNTTRALEPLSAPSFGKDDVNLETVTDLLTTRCRQRMLEWE